MKVSVTWSGESALGKASARFHFHLEDGDKTESKSLNVGGGASIFLGARSANFHFPVELQTPHPDLMAMAALKIISPYVGSRFEMDRPVSEKTATIIKAVYPWISEVVSDNSITPRPMPLEKPAISFSGGADSVAVALIMPDETPLIMSSRVYHPDVGTFEPWFKPDSPLGTMNAMPNDSRKYVVRTDFPYLSTNKKFCVYPDNYSFTIPAIIMADHLKLSHIVTGDIIAAFTGNETIFDPTLMPTSARAFYSAIGLDLECPCNGVAELVTSKIVHDNGMTKSSSTCEYGTFGNPCMRCIKCLRKSVYIWALSGQELSPEQIERFNNADPVKNFANTPGRPGLYVLPSFKYAFRRIGRHFSGAIGEIQHRAYSCDIPVGWASKHYPPVYRDRPDFIKKAHRELVKYAPAMSKQDIEDFSRLDWKSNYAER